MPRDEYAGRGETSKRIRRDVRVAQRRNKARGRALPAAAADKLRHGLRRVGKAAVAALKMRAEGEREIPALRLAKRVRPAPVEYVHTDDAVSVYKLFPCAYALHLANAGREHVARLACKVCPAVQKHMTPPDKISLPNGGRSRQMA